MSHIWVDIPGETNVHLTLVWMGGTRIGQAEWERVHHYYERLGTMTARVSQQTSFLIREGMGSHQTPVVLVDLPHSLHVYRFLFLEGWNRSTFGEWRPHISLNPHNPQWKKWPLGREFELGQIHYDDRISRQEIP